MRDTFPTERPFSNRIRQVLSPTFGSRVNAAQALNEITLGDADVVLHGADLALLAGHPSGMSHRRAAGRLGSVLWEFFPAHVALLDRDGVVVSVNQAWRRFGLERGGSPAAGLGCNYLQVCENAPADDAPEARAAAELVRLALEGRSDESRLRYQCGDRWFSMQAIPIPGRHSGALIVHSDITAETADVDRWRHQALHDALTGLPNRSLLVDRLDHALASAAREPRSLAVLFIDVDHFKLVNDRHGHAAGDAVLRAAARRMADSLRSGDTIGRWGGDEFLVIAERLETAEAADVLADRVVGSLREPIEVAAGPMTVGLSVGVAHDDRQRTAAELIDAADRAMQMVRDGRRSRLEVDR
ncbi:MAG TPA: diguanylate cyclase [Frankiaceae bacterium]|nr:diguanylate cyclase [Frankiaceae bacterium]